jgi:CheY-like chemotaxis protein
MRVLIVEDSPLVRKMYGLVFFAKDHTLVHAANGRDALDLLTAESDPFDLMLLDLRMPDMDGVQFMEALQWEGPRFRSIPIVLTTAEPEGSDLLRRARELGVTAVVHKPWKPKDLRETVQTVLGAERTL